MWERSTSVSAPPLKTLSSALSVSTAALGAADVYRMLTPGTTLTISTVDMTEGRVFVVRAIEASVGSPVTIVGEGGETIDGAASAELTVPYDSVMLQVTGGVLESIAADEVDAADDGAVITFGATAVNTTTTDRFLLQSNLNQTAQTVLREFDVPRPGTLQNLFGGHRVGNGNGSDIVYTVQVNAAPAFTGPVATLLTVTIASTSTAQAGDVVNSVVVAKGDRVSMRVGKAVAIGGSPSDIFFSMGLTA